VKNNFYISPTIPDESLVGGYDLPLIIQGAPILRVPFANRGELDFSITTGRGQVYAFNLIQTFWPGIDSGVGGDVNLVIGGQSIYTNVPADSFTILAAPREFTKSELVDVSSSQTTRLLVDMTQATNPNYFCNVQQIYYYTNDAHSRFVNAYQKKSNLGQKQLAFRLRVPGAVTPGTIFNLIDRVPKNRGRVNAFQIVINNSNSGQTDISDGFLTLSLSINGQQIVQNVQASYFLPLRQTKPQVFPCNIEAGSQFELTAVRTGVAPLPVDAYVIFYFDN